MYMLTNEEIVGKTPLATKIAIPINSELVPEDNGSNRVSDIRSFSENIFSLFAGNHLVVILLGLAR